MSETVIECAFTGRIGHEPALRESKAGNPWLALSVAVGSGDDTQWLQVAVFGEAAGELAGRLAKGDRIYVEGRLRLSRWTKDGREHKGLSVVATIVHPLGQIGRKRPGSAVSGKADVPAQRTREHRDGAAIRDWQRPPRPEPDADIPF